MTTDRHDRILCVSWFGTFAPRIMKGINLCSLSTFGSLTLTYNLRSARLLSADRRENMN